MAYGDIKRLTAAGAQVAATTAAVYTAPAGTRAELGTILLHNSSSSSEDVEIYLYGSATASRLLNITLAANETYEFSPKFPIVLSGADTIQAKASNASEINVRVFGREETGVIINPIISLNPNLWYDITDLSTMKQERTGAAATTAAVVDSPVGSWLSKGSQSVWLVAPNNEARPTLRFSGTKGYYLEFTSGEQMTTSITSLGHPVTAVTGFEQTAQGSFGYVVATGNTFATWVGMPYTTRTNFGIWAGANLERSGHSLNNRYVFGGIYNSSSSKFRINGGSFTTGNAGSNTVQIQLGLNINENNNASGTGHNNFGFAIWSGVLSDADLLIAEQALATQMGVTLS